MRARTAPQGPPSPFMVPAPQARQRRVTVAALRGTADDEVRGSLLSRCYTQRWAMGRRPRQPIRARPRARRALRATVVAATLLAALAVAAARRRRLLRRRLSGGRRDRLVGLERPELRRRGGRRRRRPTTRPRPRPARCPRAWTWRAPPQVSSSFVADRTLTSTATATASGVDLLGGIVTAASVKVTATASVAGGDAQASTGDSAVSGLHVAGVADADLPSQGSVTVPGVGTLTILDERSAVRRRRGQRAERRARSSWSTRPTDGVPAGTTIASARSRCAPIRPASTSCWARPRRRRARPRHRLTARPRTPTPTPRPTTTGGDDADGRALVLVPVYQLQPHARAGDAVAPDPRPVPGRRVPGRRHLHLHRHLRRLPRRHARPASTRATTSSPATARRSSRCRTA